MLGQYKVSNKPKTYKNGVNQHINEFKVIKRNKYDDNNKSTRITQPNKRPNI
jgi:hypothetical protein